MDLPSHHGLWPSAFTSRSSYRLPRKRHLELAHPLVSSVLPQEWASPLMESPFGFRNTLAGHLANGKLLSRHPPFYLAKVPYRLELLRHPSFTHFFTRYLLLFKKSGCPAFLGFLQRLDCAPQ